MHLRKFSESFLPVHAFGTHCYAVLWDWKTRYHKVESGIDVEKEMEIRRAD